MAANDEKVFTPEVIPDSPLPGEDPAALAVASNQPANGSNDTYRATQAPDAGFPQRVISHETISTSFNTRTKKILGEYQFIEEGALQIGHFQAGLNGDIRISPIGIVARDSAGETSFFLDAETGDASFRGTVLANDFQITGGGIIAQSVQGQRSLGGFTSLQQAINWLKDHGGGTLLVPSDTYEVTDDIVLYSNITIIGQDDDNTILDFKNTTKQIKAIGTFANPLVNIHISNIQVKNCRQIATGAIYFKYVNDSSINDNTFRSNWDGSDGRDIYFDTNVCNRIAIERNRSYDGGYLFYGGGSQINIIRNYVENNSKTGVNGNSSGLAKSIIYGNYFNNPAETGVLLLSSGNSTDNVIDSNVIFSAGTYGIGLDSSNNRIVNNRIDMVNAGSHAIFIDTFVNHVIMLGNVIDRFQTGTSGIYISANSGRNMASSNYVGANSGATCVTIAASSCTNNVITYNVLQGGTTTSDSGTGSIIANAT